MKQNTFDDKKDNMLKKHRKNKFWKKAVALLSCVTVFCTSYTMIMPAMTMSETTYCGQEEGENHTHTLQCYSNPDADLETEANWSATIPSLTGNWNEDVVAVANSQLGYHESTANYHVSDNNEKKGYTRYGAWMNDPYADWNTDFVLFCLHYANVDANALSLSNDISTWTSNGAFVSKDSYAPNAGDLIVLDENNDGAADHAAIITEANGNAIRIVEGDFSDAVTQANYDTTDARVIGYIWMPQNPAMQTAETAEETAAPVETSAPEETAQPEVTTAPETVQAAETAAPEVTAEPQETTEPEVTATPEETATAEAVSTSEATATPSAKTTLETKGSSKKWFARLFAGVLKAPSANNSDRTNLSNYITSVTAEKKSGSQWNDATEFNVGDTARFTIEYTVKDNQLVKGDVLKYQLDKDHIKFTSETSGEVQRDGLKIGTYKITKDGLITIHIDDDKDVSKAFSGTITFSGNIANDQSSEGATVNFGTNGSFTINPTPEGDNTDLSINKKGEYKNGVDFEYSVNGKMYQFSLPGGEKIALSDLIEVLGIIGDTNSGEKAAFNSVEDFLKEVANVQFSDESLVKVIKNKEGNDWTLESLEPFNTEETLTITMKNGDVVTVKVTDSQASGDLAAFITDATLEIDGKTYGAGTTWNVRPDVDYRLTLNFLEKGSRQLPGGGQEITMAMPSGLSLEPGVNGSFDIPCGLAGTLTGNTWWVDENRILHIKFADDPDDLITRSSNIHFDLELDAKFDGSENHFEFNDNVKRDAEFNYDTDVDVQKSGSYNASTGKMEYTVTVKSTGKSKNVTVSDVISGNMLTLDENSFEITPSSKTPSNTSTNSKGFTMTFGEMAHNETVTIKYTASVDTSKLGPGGKVTGNDGKNNVTVTNDDGKSDTDENITNTIKFSDIAKSSTSSEETADGEKVEMEWKITANEGQLGSIKGSKITDTIDHGSKDIMHYVVGNDGKLALTVKKIAPNGTSTTETVYVDVSKTYDQGPETWTWIPQDEGNYAYEITYKTLVTRQTENTTVKNNTSNESGGSTSGTGVVPGTNPGGGSGTDDIVGGKAAVAVTPEYIDWDIVVAIQPGDDFTDRFVIVDEIPNGADLGHKFADTFDSILSVTGLNDHEDYTYEVTKEDHNNLSPKQKDILTITFWQDKAHTNPGIDTGARTITVRIRTKNDPDWVNFADTAGGGEQAIYHTNKAKVNNSDWFTDRAAPLHTKIDKEKESNLSSVTVDGVQLPQYEYSVTLTNISELPVVITDTYDPDELVFVCEGRPGWDGHNGIAANEQKNNLNSPDSNYHATFSADNETGTLTITANSLPTKPDGSYYEFYRIYYTMRVKDADALDSFAQQAIANGGTYLIGNTAEWNGDDDHVDVEYKVPGLSKEGYFSSSSNNRQYTFILDVNRNGLEMNGGENMDLLDSHTKNLSVDYSTVKVYKITDGQSFDDAKQYQLNESMLTNEVTWNFDANEGTFSIPDRTHYVIKYDALVIGSGNQSFKNEAELKGYHASKEDSKDYGSGSHAGGTINQINLLKYEAGQTSKGLQGAVFQLFKGTGEYDPVTGDEIKEELKYGKSGTRPDGTTFAAGDNITFTTGADGTVLIALNQTQHGEQLDTGVHYYLKEINSPPGYQIDSSVEYWEFTLTDDPDEVNYGDPDRRDENGRRQWIYFSYGDILKMANTSTVEPLNVVVNKQWFDEDGNEITGENLNQDYKATIQLMRKTDSGDYVKVKVTGSGSNLTVTEVSDNSGEIELNSDNNWAYTWSQLPRVEYSQNGLEIIAHYAYKVEEVNVDGYVASVSETENETTKTYALKNYKVPENRNTEVTVKKEWQDVEGNVIPGTTEKLPDNITFSIYQVTSKTPFTRVPSSGGNKYIIRGDSHLLEGGADDTNDNYGLYQISKGESWTATFSNLPSVVTVNGETTYYAYYVKEEALTGYKTTYTSDGTTRTIVNREPLDEDSNYIDIGLEKKWTDGTNTTPPSGASATFTVHQQKSTKSGADGSISVTAGEYSTSCNPGDTITVSYTGAANSGDNIVFNYDYQWCTADSEGNGTKSYKIPSNYSDSTMNIWVQNGNLAITSLSSDAKPSYSDYVTTDFSRTITLPTTAGAWSTTVKDLIQEDAEGNLYRYYITEDSCSPTATTVSFKDKDGNDIKDTTAEGVNQTTASLNATGQKVEVTNTYENERGYELPSTGGPGTRLFTILGSIMILGAGVLLWRRRRLI